MQKNAMLFPLGFLHQQHQPGWLVSLTWGGAYNSAEQLAVRRHHQSLADQYGFLRSEFDRIAPLGLVGAHRLGEFRRNGQTSSRFDDRGV